MPFSIGIGLGLTNGGSGSISVLTAAPTGTTFDPAVASLGGIALSNGGQTATVAGANTNSFVRSVKSVTSSGKYVATFTVGANGAGHHVGLADTTQATNATGGVGLANTAKTVGIAGDSGTIFNGTGFGSIGSLGAGFAAGDVIWVAINVSTRLLWARINSGNWNNSGTANPATGVGGLTYNAAITVPHLAYGPQGGGSNVTMDPDPANKPAGFSGWTDNPTIDLAIFAGQSNATGQQTDYSIYWRPDPNIMVWNGTAMVQYVPNTVTGLEWGAVTSKWAGELNYARQFRSANPTKPLAIVKYAASGTQLYQSADGTTTYDWNPASTPELFDNAGFAIRDAKAALVAAGWNPVVRFVDWMQGEQDAANATYAAAYQTNLAALVAAMRDSTTTGRNWKVPATAKIAIGRIRSAFSQAATIRSAQLAVASADVGGPQWIYSTDDLPVEADNTHYTNAGQLSRGLRLWQVDQGTYTEPAS